MTKTMSDQSMLWGLPWEIWDRRGVLLMIGGAVLGFAALGATVTSSFILWKTAGVAQANLETETTRMKLDIALANARAREAELALSKVVVARSLPIDCFVDVLRGKPTSQVEIWFLAESPDGFSFSVELSNALKSAGWTVGPLVPLPEPVSSKQFMSRAAAAGGQPSGISVVSHEQESLLGTASGALLTALTACMGNGNAIGLVDKSVPVGILRVVVAAKPEPIFIPPPTANPQPPK
jgi:hypothetical protein